MMERLGRRLDSRVGFARFLRTEVLRKIFPDHWTFLFGEIALYSFVILVLTGIFLIFFFRPSGEEVIYGGKYAPLVGVPMSQAYRSMLHLSFDVPGGLLVRQMHHWAADLFVAAIVLHLLRNFLTGAYRNPRQENWRAGVTLLILAIFNGFSGYSIGDDLLSGAGLRIGYSIVLSVPVIGPYLAFMFLGGPPPDPALVPRLYSLHIFLVPAAIVAVLAVHLGLLWHQKHTNYPGPGRSYTTIVGSRLWPSYAAKSIALFLFVFGIVAGLGGFFEINPVWLYGPYFGPAVSAGSQPDWYLGWLEGALRLFPGWSARIFGYLIPQPFFANVLLGFLTFGFLYIWPSIAPREGPGGAVHHVLHLPRKHPFLTMFGLAVWALLLDLLFAGADDVMAVFFGIQISTLRNVLRGLVFGLPIVMAAGVYLFLLFVHRPPTDPSAK